MPFLQANTKNSSNASAAQSNIGTQRDGAAGIADLKKEKTESQCERMFWGGGEMGELIRSRDWTNSPLGPIERWPKSLRIALTIALSSSFPLYIAWGRELIQLYNDAYRPIIGDKHPIALGQRASECFPEIWPEVSGMFAQVMEKGESVGMTDFALSLDRSGFLEECNFTFSYSPIPEDSGKVGGVFVTVSETTSKVIGERRLSTLRDLAAGLTSSRSFSEVGIIVADLLGRNRKDFPFLLLYLPEDDTQLHLHTAVGVTTGGAIAPEFVSRDTIDPWPLKQFFAADTRLMRIHLSSGFPIPNGALWPEPISQAAILKVPHGPGQATGILIAGLSPRLPHDENYEHFLKLVASQIGEALVEVRGKEEERKKTEALAELDRAKTEFLSNISHEFRTPMMLMLGPLENLLADDKICGDSEIHQTIEVAHRNCQRLLKLVNTLLDFSAVQAGRRDAVREPTDLSAFTAELAGLFRSAMEHGGLKLNVDCPPLPGPVWIDRELWEKVVVNLLSNAFKFTLKGHVSVRLSAENGQIVFCVEDTGVGIPQSERHRIFQRFYRSRTRRGRSFEGTGIGLALVQDIVRLHGGEVTVQSTLGEGSHFTVTLPLKYSEAKEEVAPTPAIVNKSGAAPYLDEMLEWSSTRNVVENSANPTDTRSTVLVVDDNGDARDYLCRLLRENYNVFSAGDGRTGLEIAMQRVPDLVLTDVMMPHLDGLSLVDALRVNPRTRTVPIVVISAKAGEAARIKGLSAGADDYIFKPFSARELLARVQSQLNLSRLRHQHELRERKLLDEARHEKTLRISSDRLARLSRKLLNAQESERRRIARELHDHVGQTIALVQIKLQQLSSGASQKMSCALEESISALERLHDEVRDLCLDLRPSVLDDLGLLPALRWHADRLSQRGKLKIHFEADNLPAGRRWPGEIEIACFRVAQEAMTNVLRHANASNLFLCLSQADRELMLTVSDDGVGFDPTAAKSLASEGRTIGLLSMEERVNLAGGIFHVASNNHGGTTVSARFPIEQTSG